MPAQPLQDQHLDEETKRNMKLNNIDGSFAVTSDNLAGPYLGLFALALGATPSQIGMLNAFPNLLGNILQIPYGIMAETLGKRRLLILIGAVWNRFSWLLMAFIPFLVAPEWQVPAVIIIATLRIVIGNLGVPAWTAIQAEIIPRPMRGRYYASRNVILNTFGLLTTFAASRLLQIAFPRNYQVLFILAFIMGVFSIISFAQIAVKPMARRTRDTTGVKVKFKERAMDFTKAITGNKEFSTYTFSAFVWNFGVSLGGPLVVVYYMQNLGGTAQYWAYVQGISIVAGIVCQRYWGRLVDQYGQKNIMVKAGVGAVLVPLLWFLAPAAGYGILINFWGGFSWGGYNLAAFNLLLDITPEDNRSMYVGVYNTLMGFATAFGPLIGGFLAEGIGIRYLFLLSFIGRGLGLFLLNRNVDDSTNKPMRWRDLGFASVRGR